MHTCLFRRQNLVPRRFDLDRFHCIIFLKIEIYELWPLYCRYVPVVVDHSEDFPCTGTYLLHQGLQRRLAITIMQEQSPETDLLWKDVKELVVGRIRTTPEYTDFDLETNVLSLSLFPASYIQYPGDDRYLQCTSNDCHRCFWVGGWIGKYC